MPDRPAAEPMGIRMCNVQGLVDMPLLNNLRRRTGLLPVERPFVRCTGSAHLAGAVFRCTNPMHDVHKVPIRVADDA